ncbi:6-phospho-3-hexuloisomerase [Sporosarcina sp. BI001-red]|uniref:6-phospho-3-hexuloisomerase n=1 Tax=Sporosarcina sp. BI001-red TaxID=2282866 RepID=UPI000E28A236|nr:6-phospho-3-hexuloisomerase [Sporosarcina sp. BI001-red]REB05555.1 6-phospho-3-hexuloisomerase [Sporosarcina sp. BI001-red]
MNATAYTQEILEELKRTLSLVNVEDSEKLVDAILRAKKIFVAGGGRSGFMAKAFVMRMMHIGLDAYVVGETVTPNLEEEDLFLVGSGSGETGSLVAMTEKAKSIGATIAAVTTNPTSTIGKLADHTIVIPAQAKADSASGKSIQPMGSLFEQALLLFYDALILSVMEKSGSHSNIMYGRHANLE